MAGLEQQQLSCCWGWWLWWWWWWWWLWWWWWWWWWGWWWRWSWGFDLSARMDETICLHAWPRIKSSVACFGPPLVSIPPCNIFGCQNSKILIAMKWTGLGLISYLVWNTSADSGPRISKKFKQWTNQKEWQHKQNQQAMPWSHSENQVLWCQQRVRFFDVDFSTAKLENWVLLLLFRLRII